MLFDNKNIAYNTKKSGINKITLDKNTRNRYTDSLQKHRPIQWAPCIPCPWWWTFILLIRYVTLYLDLWSIDLERSTAGVTWSNSVPNLSEIEQSAAKLIRFIGWKLVRGRTPCGLWWETDFHNLATSGVPQCTAYRISTQLGRAPLSYWSFTARFSGGNIVPPISRSSGNLGKTPTSNPGSRYVNHCRSQSTF